MITEWWTSEKERKKIKIDNIIDNIVGNDINDLDSRKRLSFQYVGNLRST